MAKVRSIASLNIDSTVLCCNFVNTVSSWVDAERYDYLQSYGDFIDWCLKVNIADVKQLEALRTVSTQQPQEAGNALTRIKEIRFILHRLIAAVAKGLEDEIHHFLPTYNLLLRVDAAPGEQLLYSDGKFSISQLNKAGDLTAPVWLAVASLSTLLVDNDLARIKECPKCGWVFLDETKNGKRIWCNPRYCGSSDKMMRYNKKKKGSLPSYNA